MADQIWQVSVTFTEEGDRTRADAMLELADHRFHGYGRAKKAPEDPTIPLIGQARVAPPSGVSPRKANPVAGLLGTQRNVPCSTVNPLLSV